MSGREGLVAAEQIPMMRAESAVRTCASGNALEYRSRQRTDHACGETVERDGLGVVVVGGQADTVEADQHRQSVLLRAKLLDVAEEGVRRRRAAALRGVA